jgi:lysophospholipase L1-like esterase
LQTRTRNYGEGGQTTRVYLGTERMKQWKAGGFAYYMITFGLNDARYVTPEQFKKDTLELIAEVKSIGAVPILVTNVNVDAQGGHYQWDSNPHIKSYDDAYHAIAGENNIALIDVHAVFKAMNDAYNAGDRSTVTLDGVSYQLWDTRIRNTPRGAPLVLDNSQDSGKNAEWFHNIHYNAYGAKIVGDQITKYFIDHTIKF